MPTDLATILTAATLAPSAHNTQPWKFKSAENQLDFFVDWERHLTVSDPTGRELYVSLGCALANAIVAARSVHLEPQLSYFPEGEENPPAGGRPVARLTLTRGTGPAEEGVAKLFQAIKDRRTDRSLYDDRPLTAEERHQLTLTPDVILVEDRRAIVAIAEVTYEGTAATLSKRDFKNELSGWVRNSWTKQRDGMPGYALGMPAPVSLVAPLLVRVAPIHKKQSVETREEMQSASAVAVITSAGDTPRDWLIVGQTLENLWLAATAAGLAAMPLVAAIEAGERTRAQLQRIVGTANLPQSILRLGHSRRKGLKATPRRPVRDCLVK
jgi:nitroreductase